MDELDMIEAEAEAEPAEPKITCNIEDFTPKICRPEKTAILFLGTETKDPDSILAALSELQETLDIDMGVLDMADDKCQEMSERYSIDRETSQLVIFQNCEKITGVSLEGDDPKERIDKLKELLAREADEKTPSSDLEARHGD